MRVDPELLVRVRRRLLGNDFEPTAHSVAEALRAENQLCDSASVLAIVDYLRAETYGAGTLQSLLQLPDVTDVLVNGAGPVFIDRGDGLEETAVRFSTEDEVRRLAQRLTAQAGRRLDDASPWVDARLPDGTRLHAVLAPIARPGTLLSLRIPAQRRFSVQDLVRAGMMTPDIAEWLLRLVSSRAAFVISGGTGSGKTTLLAALLGTVNPSERIVIVEDATELRPDHPHVVGLESRPANVEGSGRVTVQDLVRQALRMRPDRLVVGEARGAEVVDLLAAMNTGHEGGCSTIHANSAADVPARFEALGVAAGLARKAVHSQLAAGLDVIVHVERDPAGKRRVVEIAAVQISSERVIEVVPALTMRSNGPRPGPAFDQLRRRIGIGE